MLEITVNVKAPELAAAIQSLADAIVAAGCLPVKVPDKITNDTTPNTELVKQIELPLTKEEVVEQVNQEDAISGESAAAAASSAETPAKVYSFTEVRARMGQLAQEQKQPQVKEALAKFGAKKLSDIPEEKYADLMKEVEGL